MIKKFLFLLMCCCLISAPAMAQSYAPPIESDFIIDDFKFESGESLAQLKLHYYTLGSPKRDEKGIVQNAILILHGTGGSGRQFLSPQFAGMLFGAGQLLDSTKYFIILPDGIGHGQSNKPSNGLHARFPHYSYTDMVRAHYQLVTQGLNINHLRLVMGTSMGGMHTWLWGETYPDFMDALMPLASLPVQIAGLNRMRRRMIIDSIKNDPEWNNGEYKTPPRGLTAAIHMLMLMGASPLQLQRQASTRDEADKFLHNRANELLANIDANDMIYQFDASRDYDPQPDLEKIKAPLTAINSADDLINPPELMIMEREIKRVKEGKFVLLPITDKTRGHGTHSLPEIWQSHLAELLERSKK